MACNSCKSSPCECQTYSLPSTVCTNGTDGAVILHSEVGGTTVGTGYEELASWDSPNPTDLSQNGDAYEVEVYFSQAIGGSPLSFALRVTINGAVFAEILPSTGAPFAAIASGKIFIQRTGVTSAFMVRTAAIYMMNTTAHTNNVVTPSFDASAFRIGVEGKSFGAGGTFTVDRMIVKLYKKRI